MMTMKEAASALESATRPVVNLEDDARECLDRQAVIAARLTAIELAIVTGDGTSALADERDQLLNDLHAAETRALLVSRMMIAASARMHTARVAVEAARRAVEAPKAEKLDAAMLDAWLRFVSAYRAARDLRRSVDLPTEQAALLGRCDASARDAGLLPPRTRA